jgi:DNA-binding transcriptional LysR family regulator
VSGPARHKVERVLDLNLLRALDALLAEGSVTGAARRLGLSAPAMSRTLGRIRDTVGDDVLVRAGGGMVPTRWAQEAQPRVRRLLEEARGLLGTSEAVQLSALRRRFVLRSNEAMLGPLVGPLTAALHRHAPAATLCFLPEGNEDLAALREGQIDLDLGVMGDLGPEILTQTLFVNRFVAVVRRGHPLLRGKVTLPRLCELPHLSASRLGKERGPVDTALAQLGLTRAVATVVPSFLAALAVICETDYVATLPELVALWAERHLPVRSVAWPLQLPSAPVVQAWHPRVGVDPGHRLLREAVREVTTRLAATHWAPAQGSGRRASRR